MKENKLYCSYLTPLSHPPLPSSMFRIGKDFEDDFEFLLQGISNFDLATASLSEVLVHGPLAFPIGTTKGGQAFLAGAYYGQGRVIVITHEGLFNWEVRSGPVNYVFCFVLFFYPSENHIQCIFWELNWENSVRSNNQMGMSVFYLSSEFRS